MPEKSKDELIDNILMLADNLFRQLLPTVPKELLTLDITMSQLKIILLLFVNGTLHVGAIASHLDVTLPTSTSLLDRLADKGYIIRENGADDRRVVICRLSEKGQKAVNRIWESGRIRSQEILEKMDSSNLEMFVKVLKSMMKSAEEE
jgi:DNA-binding MarR family transcriptional regulator